MRVKNPISLSDEQTETVADWISYGLRTMKMDVNFVYTVNPHLVSGLEKICDWLKERTPEDIMEEFIEESVEKFDEQIKKERRDDL